MKLAQNFVYLIEFENLNAMTETNFIKIFTGNLIITERIRQTLKDSDINAVVKEQNESNLNTIFGGHILKEIYVHKDELDKAVAIVESINAGLQA